MESPLSTVPVLLCGGTGTRLWPVSRLGFPKPFAPLLGDSSLFQATCSRVAPLAGPRWMVVANQEHGFLAGEQARAVGVAPRLVLEPVGRNTAPALAAAAMLAESAAPGSVLLVLPSDHVIQDEDAFRRAATLGVELARTGHIVTFGVTPTRPDTGMGYIRTGPDRGGWNGIEEFVEKPSEERAVGFLAAGGYLWNSGMFVVRADVFLSELDAFRPEMVAGVREAIAAGRDDAGAGFLLDREAFRAVRSESVDHAVMEHTTRGVAVPLDAGWDDAGSWDALRRLSRVDDEGNVARGDIALRGVRDTYVRAESRLVVCVGVEGLIVVETPDAVLVTERGRADALKGAVEDLAARSRREVVDHCRVQKPWGSYESLDRGEGFQVKRLVVLPGASLSLQRHRHRAEHWVVVRGTATVVRGDTTSTLAVGEAAYIPVGGVHRLANEGEEVLEVIEVQSGSYLGEDDIERLEDRYGRATGDPDRAG